MWAENLGSVNKECYYHEAGMGEDTHTHTSLLILLARRNIKMNEEGTLQKGLGKFELFFFTSHLRMWMALL